MKKDRSPKEQTTLFSGDISSLRFLLKDRIDKGISHPQKADIDMTESITRYLVAALPPT
jgi:hypothetical protein